MTAPTASATRHAILAHVAARVAESHACRLAVDGVDGAGKTIFADELADTLRAAGREVVRVSVDGFHQSRELRYRRGQASPEGFWLDSYNYDRFRDDVLAPFAPGGDRTHRRAIRDVGSDQQVDVEPETASTDALLIVAASSSTVTSSPAAGISPSSSGWDST
jgi:uridine kinase